MVNTSNIIESPTINKMEDYIQSFLSFTVSSDCDINKIVVFEWEHIQKQIDKRIANIKLTTKLKG